MPRSTRGEFRAQDAEDSTQLKLLLSGDLRAAGGAAKAWLQTHKGPHLKPS